MKNPNRSDPISRDKMKILFIAICTSFIWSCSLRPLILNIEYSKKEIDLTNQGALCFRTKWEGATFASIYLENKTFKKVFELPLTADLKGAVSPRISRIPTMDENTKANILSTNLYLFQLPPGEYSTVSIEFNSTRFRKPHPYIFLLQKRSIPILSGSITYIGDYVLDVEWTSLLFLQKYKIAVSDNITFVTNELARIKKIDLSKMAVVQAITEIQPR